MDSYINNVFIDRIEELSSEYASRMAEGKSGRYFTQAFNAAKRKFTEIAYLIYLRCTKNLHCDDSFVGNNIHTDIIRAIDSHNYTKILSCLEDNEVIVVNNTYKVNDFSKSFIIHPSMRIKVNNSRYKFNYKSTLVDLNKFKHLHKMIQSLPSIYVAQPTIEEEKMVKLNKENRKYKREIKEEQMKNTEYQKLTYDEDSLIKYCQGDEVMEVVFRMKLKQLTEQPKLIWNRYYHVFHQLPKTFREEVLRLNGKRIYEVFDVPGADLHMLAKLLETKDIPHKELIKFEQDVKQDFRKLFGICKRTGKAKAYVKTSFKRYLFARSDFYNNLRTGSTCWHIDQYFQTNYPSIREELIKWDETNISGKKTKSLWADSTLIEFETISVRMRNLLQQRFNMPSITCHDAVYLIEEDAERITDKQLLKVFYDSLDLLVDRQETLYNI